MRRVLPEPDRGPVDLTAAYAVPEGPQVRVNFVASADGAAVVEGRSGTLSGPADKRVFRVLRSLADVVLVGAGTARAEGYGPVVLDDDQRERRAAAGLPPVPPLAVVTASLALDLDSPLFTQARPDARTLVVTCARADAGRRAAAAEVADVVVAGDERVDVGRALDALTERGLTRVLCEGGPALTADLVAADRLDELCLTLAPLLAGGAAAPRVTAGAASPPRGLRLAAALEADDFLFLRYARAAGG